MKGFRRLFADHMRSDEFAADLGRAADLAAAGRAALLCLERDPGRCHRVYVAEALGERLGLPVVHLEP
jgi:uncharacterized protein (DUF488 family)